MPRPPRPGHFSPPPTTLRNRMPCSSSTHSRKEQPAAATKSTAAERGNSMPPSPYTHARLSGAVAASTSMCEVLRHLGLDVVGGHHPHISRRTRALGIDTSHFGNESGADARQRRTRQDLPRKQDPAHASRVPARRLRHCRWRSITSTATGAATARRTCASRARTATPPPTPTGSGTRAAGPRAARARHERRNQVHPRAADRSGRVLRRLDIPNSATTRRLLHRWISEGVLDTSHFLGQAHQRGKPGPTPVRSAEDILMKHDGRRRTQSAMLRRALRQIGVAELCVRCGTSPSWHGRPMTLEVDHISGDRSDDRAENLRLLCPNCHAITSTWCRGGARRRTA
ncbi:HNH endonuclease [Streptomyces sp. NPDC053560]|uniref:HNH endonuclease n=1 Tax=Streptomyces sp. NPDC053560 TaxID=3365711 RepID=UPI0037CF3FCE